MADLTEKEKEIYDLLLTDFSLKQIANQLKISNTTLKTHLSNIYEKRRYCGRIDIMADEIKRLKTIVEVLKNV